MATGELGRIDKQVSIEANEGLWLFDDDDWALIAMLKDPVSCAELLFEDPLNTDYAGCYTVRDYQYPLFRSRRNYNIAPCARDVGKALPLDEEVLTPSGWTTMGGLAVGDYVIGGDGRPTRVVGYYPQGPREIVELEFADGAKVECDYDHLWSVTTDTWAARGTGNGGYQEITTRQIVDTLGGDGHKMGGPRQRWRTPLVGPVQFTAADELPLDPYLLGLLLGDGNLTRPTMVRYATIDDELLDAFRERLDDAEELVHDAGCNYRLRRRSRTGNGRSAPKLLTTLRHMGLMGHAAHEKFVPGAYLSASLPDRLALVQGLVDTDGHVVKHSGGVDFSTASKQLANDVRRLVLSLGGRCAWTARATAGRESYRLHFRLPPGMQPARLTRKRVLHEVKANTMSRAIVGARPVGLKLAACIKVAAADGRFVTRDFVVTHNTESIKAKAVSHIFKRLGEGLLLSAPQMIHLDPLTKEVEERITKVRLTNDFLKKDSQRTGFVHNPFRADFLDGTHIVGRIPHQDGKGVKGQHVPDLIIDEGQDYPEAGWTEVFPTVMKDHTDHTGAYDFTMTFYGVHGAGQGGTFGRLAKSPAYDMTVITRLQTPKWGAEEKAATAAMYGGTNSPDYRRNVLGEPGQAFSQFFATARLMACMDQDADSRYNTMVFKEQEWQAEEVDSMIGPEGDVGDLFDLPSDLGQQVFCGMDIGLVSDPTVIMIFAVMLDKNRKSRLQLIRMFHLWRFRERQIRAVVARIGRHYGLTLRAFGYDMTGLGLPIFQAMEDDEEVPQHLKEVSHGYVFNAKVPVSVDKNYVSEQGKQLVDQYGNIVEIVRDKWTGQEQLVVRMTMIEASTRYLRGFVDNTFMLLPFHDKLIADFQGETEQRVKAMAGVKKKPSAFHMLDAARAMAMAYKQGEIEEQVYAKPQVPVLDRAIAVSPY